MNLSWNVGRNDAHLSQLSLETNELSGQNPGQTMAKDDRCHLYEGPNFTLLFIVKIIPEGKIRPKLLLPQRCLLRSRTITITALFKMVMGLQALSSAAVRVERWYSYYFCSMDSGGNHILPLCLLEVSYHEHQGISSWTPPKTRNLQDPRRCGGKEDRTNGITCLVIYRMESRNSWTPPYPVNRSTYPLITSTPWNPECSI